jgi:hypothetical protein
MQHLEILTFSIGYFLLKNMFELLLLSRIGLLLASQELLICFLLVYLVAPVVHPLHAVQMGPWNETCLHLDAFKFIVMLLLK